MFTHTNNFAIYFIYKRVSNSFIENNTRYYNFANSKLNTFCRSLLQLSDGDSADLIHRSAESKTKLPWEVAPEKLRFLLQTLN